MVETIRTRPNPLRSFFLLFSVLTVLTVLLLVWRATPVFAQSTTIGIFTDETGSQCSFIGDDTGQLTAYVVVRPDLNGVRGARFKAVLPSCFQATYLGEVVPAGLSSVGNSQTGISITSGLCEMQPVNVLQIQYMRTGGTTACCDFQLEADPLVGYVQGLDCTFTEIPLTSVVSHFNADETCLCHQPNLAPYQPTLFSPLQGANTVSAGLIEMAWGGSDPEDDPLVYDVYLGTSSSPPLVESDHPTWTYTTGPLEFLTKYYWRIVARDPYGLEASSGTRTFTTSGNGPPTLSTTVTPEDGAIIRSPATQVSWDATDPDGRPLYHYVYFGTTPTPPLAPDFLSGTPPYDPGLLQVNTTYYWHVVVSDGVWKAESPTYHFTVILPGDVNQDNVITVADAACALQTYLSWETGHATPCGGTEGLAPSDVNCDGAVTPGDARCIHKSVVDGSCEICDGAPPTATSTRAVASVVTSADAWIEWDSLIVQLAVSGVPSLKSFGFEMITESEIPLGRIVRTGATSGFEAFESSYFFNNVYWGPHSLMRFAGYTLGEVDATSETVFIEIRCYLPTRSFTKVGFVNFTDDLEDAPGFYVFGNEVPVAFASFAARTRDGGIDVSWELSSDETIDSYTLYRHSGATTLPIAIAQGAVTSARGSYFDRAVEAGITYRYELAVTTHSGETFRSQLATATAAAVKLALYQNQPNPFNPQTTIRYDLPPGGTRVRLLILDVSGRLVRTLVDRSEAAGTHSAVWDGRDNRGGAVSSGVYFYVLAADKERLTRKLVLLK